MQSLCRSVENRGNHNDTVILNLQVGSSRECSACDFYHFSAVQRVIDFYILILVVHEAYGALRRLQYHSAGILIV